LTKKKTKEYYASLPIADTQGNRNFKKNTENLTEEERSFFGGLCIDWNKVDIDGTLVVSPIFRRKKYWICETSLYYYGEIISAPDDYMFVVGRFDIILTPKDELVEPGDMPYIYVLSDELEWLLDEKCEDIQSEATDAIRSVIWDMERLPGLNRLFRMVDRKRKKSSIIKCFKELGMNIMEQYSKKEIEDYKKNWVNQYASNSDIAKYALPSSEWHNYIWHVFSYDKGKAVEGNEAMSCYNNTDKEKAVIYIENIDMLLLADNIHGLTAEELERMSDDENLDIGNLDIVVTDEDFSWTYCRTHEYYCGPYFYHK
jgi:hypothetical protein